MVIKKIYMLGPPVGAQIRLYPAIQRGSGGRAWKAVNDEKPLFCMAFRRYWIENYVTRQTDKLSVIAVKGDSMEGILNHGDNILINHAETEPRDGLYVLRIGNDLFVKNIQRLPGRLLVKSANPLYEPFEIDLTADNTDTAIIGRVEWFGRTVN